MEPIEASHVGRDKPVLSPVEGAAGRSPHSFCQEQPAYFGLHW